MIMGRVDELLEVMFADDPTGGSECMNRVSGKISYQYIEDQNFGSNVANGKFETTRVRLKFMTAPLFLFILPHE